MHADHDVFEDGQVREQADVLKGAGDAAVEHLMRPPPADLLAGEADRPAIGGNQAGDRVEQGRFARAVRPDHGDDRMRRDRELDRAQGDEAAEPHGQPGNLEQRAARRALDRAQARQPVEPAASDLGRLLGQGQRLHRPRRRDQALAAIEHHEDEDQPEDQLDRGRELDMPQPADVNQPAERLQPAREILEHPGLQDLEDQRADHHAPYAADAAENDHDQDHDRHRKHEHVRGRGLQFGDVEGAGGAGKGGAGGKGQELRAEPGSPPSPRRRSRPRGSPSTPGRSANP